MSRIVPPAIWQVESFARCLSLRDLASLATARKDWQDSIASLFGTPHARQLVKALQASSHSLQHILAKISAKKKPAGSIFSVPTLSEQLSQLFTVVAFLQQACNVPWGPAVAAAPGLLQDFTQLLTVPNSKFKTATCFVKHTGLRITYQQLLTAAHEQVAGVDTWVRAQQELGIHTDLPDVVVAICYHNVDQLRPDWIQPAAQTPQDAANILQLAVNTGHKAAAALVADALLPCITNPAVLFHLLHTAIMREHHAVLESALASPAAKQLTAAAVVQLMQAAADQSSPLRMWASPVTGTSMTLLHCLVQLPAAHELDSSVIVSLMQILTAKSCWFAVEALCTLQAAQDMPVNDLRQLLKLAIAQERSTAVEALCDLSAADDLTIGDVKVLMLKAAEVRSHCSFVSLSNLPAAQHLAANFLGSMLLWAVRHRSSTTVAVLRNLPAAAEISSTVWLECACKAAINLPESEGVPGMLLLCSLPVADRASPADLEVALKAAIQYQQSASARVLCESPAAQKIPSETIFGLLKYIPCRSATLQTWDYYSRQDCTGNMLKALSSLESVQQMDASEFLQFISVLVNRGCSDKAMLRSWFECRAAHTMPLDLFIERMQFALQQRSSQLLQTLCQIPAASGFRSTVSLLQLIDRALQLSDRSVSRLMLRELCKLPAASLLSGKQLAGVLSAIVRKNYDLVMELCSLPAASLLRTAQMADLLRTAVEYANSENVKLLCRMQVSNYLSGDTVGRLLLAAVLSDVYDMVSAVCSLRGAAEITNISKMLKLALQLEYRDAVQELLKLPAAQGIKADALLDYLDIAIRSENLAAVDSLCKLPSAIYIQKQVALELLQSAVQMHSTCVLCGLCQLKAAHRISAESLVELLQKTIPRGDKAAMLALTRLLKRVLVAKKYFSSPT